MADIFTGAKAIVKIDGFEAAFISSITITHENRLEEIPQLDNLEVAEYAENGHRCSFTINMYKLNDQSNGLVALGLDPIDIRDILIQPETYIQVVDDEDNVQYEMTGVKFEGGSGSIDARGVWIGTWTGKARRGRGL